MHPPTPARYLPAGVEKLQWVYLYFQSRGEEPESQPSQMFYVLLSEHMTDGFSLAAVPFLAYALAELVLLALVSRQLFVVRTSTTYTAIRALIAVCLVGVILDNVRHFAGGAWRGATSPPPFANVVYGLTLLHLVLVPLLIYVQAELCLAAANARRGRHRADRAQQGAEPKTIGDPRPMSAIQIIESDEAALAPSAPAGTEPRGHAVARAVAALVSVAIATAGLVDAIAIISATGGQLGLQRVETFGVVVYNPVNMSAAETLGYATAGPDLLGVQAFGFTAFVAGIFIACQERERPRAYVYLGLSFAGLVGQAMGAISTSYMFFASNFFEIVSFAAMVIEDGRLFVPYHGSA